MQDVQAEDTAIVKGRLCQTREGRAWEILARRDAVGRSATSLDPFIATCRRSSRLF